MSRFTTIPLFLLLLIVFSVSVSYNESLAGKMGDMCRIAYCPEETVVSWTCKPCGKWPDAELMYVISNPLYSVFGFVAHIDEGLVFSFEGTQDFEDVVIDLQFGKAVPYKDHPTARVHEGFWTAYSSVREELLSIAEKTDRPILCTGHSLGAAMGTLLALDLQETLGKTCTMYNLGSPRVGNEDFGKLFFPSSENYRVTHWDDPVPHLPFRAMDFLHVGEEVWYNEDWTHKTLCESEGKGCSNSRKLALSVHDHRVYFGENLTHCI
jgi:hypothetical protein